MSHNSTNAAYWKRRAIKAETEVQTWRNIRSVDNSMEMQIVSDNAVMRTALNEIREALDGITQYPTQEE